MFLRKHCEVEIESLREQMGVGDHRQVWKLTVDERIIIDTLSDLSIKLDRVIFHIEDTNSRDLDRHTYQNSSKASTPLIQSDCEEETQE